MILVSIDDFSSFQTLAYNNYQQELLQSFIDRFEKQLIINLFGVTMGEDIIEYLTGSGSLIDPDLDFIIGEFYQQDDDKHANKIWHSRGLKDYLISGIYYEYVFFDQSKHTQSGTTKKDSEPGINLDFANNARVAEYRWNDSTLTACAIQWYVKTNKEAYPDFKGIEIKTRYTSII